MSVKRMPNVPVVSVESSEDEDDAKKSEDGDPDLFAAFQQLKHSHELLLRDKRNIETLCSEMEKDNEAKENAIEELRKRNAALANVARQLEKNETEALEESVVSAFQEDGVVDEDDLVQQLSELTAEDIVETVAHKGGSGDAAVIDHLKRHITALNTVLRKQAGKLKKKSQENECLRDELQDQKKLVRDLQRQGGRTSIYITAPDRRSVLFLPPAVKETEAAVEANARPLTMWSASFDANEPEKGDAGTTPELQSQLDVEKSKAEATIFLEKLIVELEEDRKQLRDALDEANHKLKESQRELRAWKIKSRYQEESLGALLMNDEAEGDKGDRGLTHEETVRLLTERIELKTQLDEIRDEIVEIKMQGARSQWEKEYAVMYCRNRDQIFLNVLKKSINTATRKKLTKLILETPLVI